MALLLQCLRDVRTQTGDVDMLPPASPQESPDGGPPRHRGELEVAAHRPAFKRPAVVPRLRDEPAEACY